MKSSRIANAFLVLALSALLLLPAAAQAGTLSTSVIGMFPKDAGEFAYADLKAARQFKWFPQLEQQMLPPRFREFEKFLAAAGVDTSTQVEELAWAFVQPTQSKDAKGAADAKGATEVPANDQVVGIALGQFNPNSAEAYFKAQKLPTESVNGFTLFAYGSGAGPQDLFFLFIDSNTAAFGQRATLEKVIGIRNGVEESLLRNTSMFPLITEVNGHGVVWAVLDSAFTKLGMQQLLPEAQQFPQADQIAAKLKALTIDVGGTNSLTGRFQAVCATPDDANTFAAMLQAAMMYRRYQVGQSNPEMTRLLDQTSITPRGDRLEVRLTLTEEQMLALIQNKTFTFQM